MIFAYILIVATLAGITFALVWKLSHGGIVPWKQLGTSSVYYVAPPGFNPMQISIALERAINILAANTRWTHEDLNRCAENLHVFVVDGTAWKDEFGRDVAGETLNSQTIYVLRDLKALCHEFAHVVEIRFNGMTDSSHASWQTNGIQRALNAYEEP